MKKIPIAQPVIIGNELKYVRDCVRSTWISHGKYIDEFEKGFAKFCETKYATTVVNGTAALHLLLAAMEIGKGDEVIMPSLTFVATANAASYLGAKPVFVDVEYDTWNIDPTKIEKKITTKTKAIIAVHLYGHPADIDPINALGEKYGIPVLEDACEAHGALYKRKKVGSLSKAAIFSFYGNKIITTGEGGIITSNNKKLIERAIYLKSHAMNKKRKYYHKEIGYNYRMTNLQAAIGLAQLENISKLIATKRKNARTYNMHLERIDGILLPSEKEWAESVFWMYSIILKKLRLKDKLARYLSEKGIETRPFFEPMHKLPMYKTKESLRNTEFLSTNGISLPSGVLLTSDQIYYISQEIKKFAKKYI